MIGVCLVMHWGLFFTRLGVGLMICSELDWELSWQCCLGLDSLELDQESNWKICSESGPRAELEVMF